jgi:hypothetical protein
MGSNVSCETNTEETWRKHNCAAMDGGRTVISTTLRSDQEHESYEERAEAEVLEKETALHHERTERTVRSVMILRPRRFRKGNVRYVEILPIQEVRAKVQKEVDWEAVKRTGTEKRSAGQ